jgi:hypothetical protein
MENKLKFIIFLSFITTILGLTGCNNTNIEDKVVIYNTDTIKTKVNMIQPEGNLTFIKANVNNKDVVFLLDSGAGSTVLDKDQLDSYGLTYVEAGSEFQGVGGSNQLYIVTNLNKITIEGKEFSISCKASNLSNVVSLIRDASGIQIIGILGSDFFTEHNVIFDYKEKAFFIPEN